jgi:hypothetical protein
MINEESGCKVRFIPKLERHTGTRKERHSNVDNVSMFALRNDILLMCVRACHVIGDTYASEKLIQLLIFKPPPPHPQPVCMEITFLLRRSSTCYWNT